ncbi:YhcH/YjgK/YiaL family protein [Uliginosibacterium gangwonense]|uniref:YhcH/YjgK/YiaL family protein n=1 Tax=Uliginosibacterium gangwonense TaxID=392736 RepID=UPI0003829F75|nr:YhcH/YjgK/YiaL family protein [Uliginosibacterium gangwonense]
MFIGTLAHWAEHKKVLPAAIVTAVDAVRSQDLAKLAAGRYEIDGSQMFFMIQEMNSKKLEDTRSEAHRQYADVQIVLNGPERYGVAPPDGTLAPTEDRLEEKDIAFYPDPANESFVDLASGMFTIFYPGEFHRPCCNVSQTTALRKIVIKVHRSLLGL